MTLLTILAIQVCLLIVGYLMAVVFGVAQKLEALAVAYLLGSGVVSIVFLLLHWLFGLNLDATNFIASVFLTGGLAFLITKRMKKTKEMTDFRLTKTSRVLKSLSVFEKSLLILLFILVGYTIIENYVWPVTAWDSLALYDFRARVMAVHGNMVEGIQLGYFFQYPPFTSFLHLFGYVFGNERIKLAYSFIFASLLTSFFVLLRRKQPLWIALLGTLFLAVDSYIFGHSTVAYTNLSYVTFLTLGLIYLLFWFHEGAKKDLLLGAFLLGLSTWVRSSEPFWLVGIGLILLRLFTKREQVFLGLLMIFLMVGISRLWGIFVQSLYAANNFYPAARRSLLAIVLSSRFSFELLLSRIQEIGGYFYLYSLNVWRYLLLPFGFSFYYDWRAKNKHNLTLAVMVGLLLSMLFGGIFFFSLYY